MGCEDKMAKPKIFITRKIPQAGLDQIADDVDMEVWPDELPPPYETLLEAAQVADGLVTLLTDKVDEKVIEAGKRLKVISQYAVGVDNIDLAAATRRGIPVGHTPGVLTETTADFAWTLLMATARRVVEGDKFTRAGRWQTWGPLAFLGPDIHGATLGIVGFGRIGQAVARRAQGFNMQVIYYDVQRNLEAEQDLKATFVPFNELLRIADFISLHTWLSPDTYHMISDDQFKVMKRTAILVNTARGSIIDPQALYLALKNNLIAGAGLDVTEPEPIPTDSPLLTLDNLVIAPHIASASVQSRTRMALMTAENLLAGLKGERLPYCANPTVYP
jgi:glyoxylate reductase